MPDLSAYTHKFRATGDQSHQNGVSKVNRRNRQPVSCTPCRVKKLKCDRGHPCETCVKRGDDASCAYGPVNIGSRHQSSTSDGGRRAQAQDRLRNLENLVMQMMKVNSIKDGPQPLVATPDDKAGDDSKPAMPNDGHMRVEGSEAKYVGSTHWSAILDSINELKSVIATESFELDRDQEKDRDASDPDILFGATAPQSLERILQQHLPLRLQVDRRLSVYFHATYGVIPILHSHQFQRQYEEFWANPLETPPLWVAILFSILCMSASLSQVTGAEPFAPANSPRDGFLTAAAQCLVLGGYTRPKRFGIEALLLFSQCIYFSSMDSSREVSIIFCIIIRLAYRMGYHRDPDHFAHFSPFDGEMRRRVWAMCLQFDMMISFQLGLPGNIPTDVYDTRTPRNLLDADFNEFSTSLPTSRPETETTQIMYFIVKTRLMRIFGKICRQALAFEEASEEEIMRLDSLVRKEYESIPAPLRIRSMSQSFTDPSSLVMVRINCEFLFQKSICVLHRKRMERGNVYSRDACVNAAVAIMGHLIDLNKEFQPGGQLYADRWMLSSFTMSDFLLAAMVLALAVWVVQKDKSPKRIEQNASQIQMHLNLLGQAYTICQEWGNTTKEPKLFAEALGIMIQKLKPPLSLDDSRIRQNSFQELLMTPLSLDETQVTASSGQIRPSPNSEVSQSTFNTTGGGMLNHFDNLFAGVGELDWTVFDQYLSIPSDFTDVGEGWTSTPFSFLGMPQGNARERWQDYTGIDRNSTSL